MKAYVTLVMRGDEYIRAALALAKSLRKSGTRYALVCMVTADVSSAALSALSHHFHHLEKVQYISSNCTKWNCLKLTKYKKIIYMDAAQVVMKNLDRLFKCSVPCLSFSNRTNKKNITYTQLKNAYVQREYIGSSSVVVLKPSIQLFKCIVMLAGCLTLYSGKNKPDEIVFMRALLQNKYNVENMSTPEVINYSRIKKPWLNNADENKNTFVWRYFDSLY